MNVSRPFCTCTLCMALVLPAHADACHETCDKTSLQPTSVVRLYHDHVPELDRQVEANYYQPTLALVSSNDRRAEVSWVEFEVPDPPSES